MNPSLGPPANDGFRQYLEKLGRSIEPGSGFFSPDTVFWHVSREPALLLAGMRALLLQIAHPKVVQGVADHSRYREDPWVVGFAPLLLSTVSCLAAGMRRSRRPCGCVLFMIVSMVR